MTPLSRILAQVLLIVLTSSAFIGCAGYQLGSVKPAKLSHIESIAIPTAKNETLEPRIAVNVTNHVIKAFHNDGTYKISTSENADAILDLIITDIENRQLRSARFNTLRSRELEVRMTINFTLTDANTGGRLMRGRIREETNIFLDPNQQTTERQAIDNVARKAAAEIVTRVAEGWPGEETLTTPEYEARMRVLRERVDTVELENDTFDN